MNSYKYTINLSEHISILRLSSKIEDLLIRNNICNLYELVNKNKNNLKKIGCTPNQINDIEIKSQLEGLDLNMKC